MTKRANRGQGWYVPGIHFGTEFGNTMDIDYSFSIKKLSIQQTLK